MAVRRPFKPKDLEKVGEYCNPELRRKMAKALRTLRKKGRKITPGTKLLYKNPALRTRRVKDFAGRFPKTEKGIRAMINTIHGFLVKEKPSIAQKVYGIQTVDDVLRTQRIPSPIDPKSKRFVWGCRIQAYTLYAALVEKGITAHAFRTFADFDVGEMGNPHTCVIFEIGKKKFLGDPFALSEDRRMMQIGETLGKRIRELRAQKRFVREEPRFVGFLQFMKEKI